MESLETIMEGIFGVFLVISPVFLGIIMAEWRLRYIFGPRSKPHTPLTWGKGEIIMSNHHKDESK